MRLFIAIRFPEPVLDALCQRQARLQEAVERGRFSRQDNLHLTLAFLGDVPPSAVAKIRRVMDAATGPAFSFKIGRPGRFRRDGGDVLWLAIDAPRALYALQSRLSTGLTSAGFRLEDRVYTPHLTIARSVLLRPGQDLHRLGIEFAPISCQAQAVCLMQSERIGGVLTYTELYRREMAPLDDAETKRSAASWNP